MRELEKVGQHSRCRGFKRQKLVLYVGGSRSDQPHFQHINLYVLACKFGPCVQVLASDLQSKSDVHRSLKPSHSVTATATQTDDSQVCDVSKRFLDMVSTVRYLSNRNSAPKKGYQTMHNHRRQLSEDYFRQNWPQLAQLFRALAFQIDTTIVTKRCQPTRECCAPLIAFHH